MNRPFIPPPKDEPRDRTDGPGTLPTAAAEIRALLISEQLPDQTDESVKRSLDELAELLRTLGGREVGRLIQPRDRRQRTHYLGKGKVRELADLARSCGANLIVADDELSGLQQQHLEEDTGVPTLDRTSVILEIFAEHASSRAGILQVELARLRYQLPRLTGMWGHFSRQRGGIGTKGPGETQLEADRRTIRKRIRKVVEDLEKVRQDRDIQRARRTERFSPLFALVGYTNAGKTTLLNRLAGSDLITHDGLFTTLDPSARRVRLPGGRGIVVSDTVGFIQKLPHTLVEAFKSTLEDVITAQVIVHVVDIAAPALETRIAAVRQVLEEIGVADRDPLMVFNQIDRLTADAAGSIGEMLAAHPGAVAVSARTGAGIDELLAAFEARVAASTTAVRLRVPASHPLVTELMRSGHVVSQHWEAGHLEARVDLPTHLLGRVRGFVVDGDDQGKTGDVPAEGKGTTNETGGAASQAHEPAATPSETSADDDGSPHPRRSSAGRRRIQRACRPHLS